ncbi:glycosyltransferase family protein [Flavobacterium luteum]|uniref:UDP-glycosyltransferase n=1 Tax=Flavobacterium luteum TaxID=2026654 RepID=A0A7J5AEK6_9FLAO|nr:UDP-glycosyltransferase [Flavobacterium luteum]KAB1155868.1 UDP-glycosyltransferase [Flavobacterium luteum]
MTKKKIFILLPDGLGLRNFGYSDFYQNSLTENNEIIFWNITSFPLAEMGYKELKIENSKIHPLTDIYKNAKVQVVLNLNIKKSNDKVYNEYRFPFSYKNYKNLIKNILIQLLTLTHSSEKGLFRIRKKIIENETKTLYYSQCLETLQIEKPSIVFCTNQRHITTVAPLLAAKALDIPTASLIFSWDNLPKATMVVETDYYFVWSNFMKEELLFYYPYIKPVQIVVTGSPQFELHFDSDKLLSRNTFFQRYGLDFNKKYICYSGDDFTSSPDDEKYLEDLAIAVEKLNQKNYNIGIIFRRCPVDFSSRYDAVLEKYSDCITIVNPLWKPLTSIWNAVLPTKDDDTLLSSIAEHSEMVVNLGSSTVFDFVAHKKPCGYFNYNQHFQLNPKWDIFKCYQFVHFRSMPTKDSVFWINNPEEIAETIEKMLSDDSEKVIKNAQLWFEKINQHPPELASERIWDAIAKIIDKD